MNISELKVDLFDTGIPSIIEGNETVAKKQMLKPVFSRKGIVCQVLFIDDKQDIEKLVIGGIDGEPYCEEIVFKIKPLEPERTINKTSEKGELPPSHPRPTEEELNDFRKFISEHTWKTSTTMANFSPHQYILNFPCWKMKEDGKCAGFCDSCKQKRAEFEKWVKFIRKYGERQKMLKTVYTVLCVDDKQYWTMGDPMNTTWVMNRALINDPKRVPKLYWLDRV